MNDPFVIGASNELVRRDLESRFLASERNASGGPSTFMSRPGELHPHHALLSHLSSVNHLSPHNPNGNNPPPHSALFPPPLVRPKTHKSSDLITKLKSALLVKTQRGVEGCILSKTF